MHNQFKSQKFKHLMLAMGPRDLNSAPYSPVHCSSHSMTSFQSSELTELPVVENGQLFAQRVHSARTAHGTPPVYQKYQIFHIVNFAVSRDGHIGLGMANPPKCAPGKTRNFFARRAPRAGSKPSVPASRPAKFHSGTIEVHRRGHPSLTQNFKRTFLPKTSNTSNRILQLNVHSHWGFMVLVHKGPMS